MNGRIFILFLVIYGVVSCKRERNCVKEESEFIKFKRIEDTTYQVSQGSSFRKVRVYQPNVKKRGTILLLPGWNYPIEHWSDSTKVLELARREGYNLVMPDMGKTIYHQRVYPETRSDWKGEATRSWIYDTLIPFIQGKTGLLLTGDPNFILGISTGGRGAVIIGFEQKGRFKAIASLSGDFDQSAFPQDNLYKGYFGSAEQFPERYKEKENPCTFISEDNPALMLVHGKDDQIVPAMHSTHFYKRLKENKGHQLRLVNGQGHQYTFWNSEMEAVFSFFNRFTSSSPSLD